MKHITQDKMNNLIELCRADKPHDSDLKKAIAAAAADAPLERPDIHNLFRALDMISDERMLCEMLRGGLGNLWLYWSRQFSIAEWIKYRAKADNNDALLQILNKGGDGVPGADGVVDTSLLQRILSEENTLGKRERELYETYAKDRQGQPFTLEDAHYFFRAFDAVANTSDLCRLLEEKGLNSIWHTWRSKLAYVDSISEKLQRFTNNAVRRTKELLNSGDDEALRPFIADLIICSSCNTDAVPTLFNALDALKCTRTLAEFLMTDGLGHRLTRHSRVPDRVDALYERLTKPISGVSERNSTDGSRESTASDWEWELALQQALRKRNKVAAADLSKYMTENCQRACVLSSHGHVGAREYGFYRRHGKEHEKDYFNKWRLNKVCYEHVVVDVNNFAEAMERCARNGTEVCILQMIALTEGLESYDFLSFCEIDAVILAKQADVIELTVVESKTATKAKAQAQGQAAVYKRVLEAMIKQADRGHFKTKVSAGMNLANTYVAQWDTALVTAGLKFAIEDVRSDGFWTAPKALLNKSCAYYDCTHLARCREGLKGRVAGITGVFPDIENLGLTSAWKGCDLDFKHRVVGRSSVKWDPYEDPPVPFSYHASMTLKSLPEEGAIEVFITQCETTKGDACLALYCEGELLERVSYCDAVDFMNRKLGDSFGDCKALQGYTLHKGTANHLVRMLRVKNPRPQNTEPCKPANSSKPNSVPAPAFVALSDVAREMCTVPVLCSDRDVIQYFKVLCGEEATTSDLDLAKVILAHFRSICNDYLLHAGAYTPRRGFITDSKVDVGAALDALDTEYDEEAATWLAFTHKRLAQEMIDVEMRRRRAAKWDVVKCTEIKHGKPYAHTHDEDEPEGDEADGTGDTAPRVKRVKLDPVGWGDRIQQTDNWEYEFLSFDEALQNKKGVLCDITQCPKVQGKTYALSEMHYLDFGHPYTFKVGAYYVLKRRESNLNYAILVNNVATREDMKTKLFAFGNPIRYNRDAVEVISKFLRRSHDGITLTDGQMNLIKSVCKNRLTVCCGPPGSGKTVAAQKLIHYLLGATDDYHICVVSKNVGAVERLLPKDLKASGHVNMFGMWKGDCTAPRVFGMSLETFCGGTQEFKVTMSKEERKSKGEVSVKVPEAFDVIVVDEASQVEGYAAAALLSRLKKEGRLVVIGDPMQLGVNRDIKWEMPERVPLISNSLLMSVLRTKDGRALRAAHEVSGELADYIIKQDQYLRSDKRINELTRCLYGGSETSVQKSLSRRSDVVVEPKWKCLGDKVGGLLTVYPPASGTSPFDVANDLGEFLMKAYTTSVNGEPPKVHIIMTSQKKLESTRGVEVTTIENFQGGTTDVGIVILERADALTDKRFCKVSTMNVAFTRASHLAVLVMRCDYAPHASIATHEECRLGFAHIKRFEELSTKINLTP
eukprot:TRINITY_DN1400_c0_g1_i1.p1 TRINITY_DN1400_c0_g1~~TRINITY_DN1400_c0_g1_i1.p1  ORF type:complete len:1412 (+),score=357.18 TRINITY_DN1400_c0_g1_i1:326-4561(+)